MFSAEYRLRYSDTDKNGNIRISTIIDLLQDISINHAAFAGLDAERLKTERIAFLLDGWRVCFKKALNTTEGATVKTGIMRIRKFETLRKYEIWQGGELKIIATAVWYSVDTEKRSIVSLNDDFYSGFDNISEEENGFKYTNLRPDKSAVKIANSKISKRDIDTNKHMNNMKAVDFLMDFIPDNIEISELKVKYRKELLEDEEIEVYTSRENDGYYAEIRNSDDIPCVLLKVI